MLCLSKVTYQDVLARWFQILLRFRMPYASCYVSCLREQYYMVFWIKGFL